MIQQVNLYQDIVRQEQDRTSLNFYSAGLISIPLLLMGISLYLLWNLSTLKTQVEQTRKKLSAEEARVTNLLSKFPKQENDSVLASQIALVQNKVSELSQTIHLLTEKNSDFTQGFSQHFQALANQAIPEVWLSKIYISASRQIVNLEGSTFKPERIPYFLQQLEKEPVFHGQTFAKLIMQKSEKTPGPIDFKLDTTTDSRDSNEYD